MSSWKIAGVQMDCRYADTAANMEQIVLQLREAAQGGARLVIFPECILTGYCFASKEEAWPHAQTIPGPATERLARECRELSVWCVVGMLEKREEDGALFNAAVLVGPNGLHASYRKIHLPFLGIDRFVTPGDRPFAVHDIGGLRVGMLICYDGIFPEACRSLMLLGADLVALPTNWPLASIGTVRYIVPARALENWLYYAAVDRIGMEGKFRFLGHSRVADCTGELLAASDDDKPAILYADIDPERARRKRVINVAGEYELDRLGHRRPEMYGELGRLIESKDPYHFRKVSTKHTP